MSDQALTLVVRDKSTITLSEIFEDPTILEGHRWGCCVAYGHKETTLKNKLYGILPKLKWLAKKGLINPDILSLHSQKWQNSSWEFQLVNIEKDVIVLVLHPESKYIPKDGYIEYARLSVYNIDTDDIESINKISYESVKRYEAKPYNVERKGDRFWQSLPHAWISKCDIGLNCTLFNINGSTWSDIKRVLDNDEEVAGLIKKYANKTEYNDGPERPEKQFRNQTLERLSKAKSTIDKLIKEGAPEDDIENAKKEATDIVDEYDKVTEKYKSKKEHENDLWPNVDTFRNPKYFLQ